MLINGKIIGFTGDTLTVALDEPVDRELLQKSVETVEIRLNDGRCISNEQRRKIFALVRDIALWSGHEPEFLRQLMTWSFVCKRGIEPFSLSDVDMSTAKDFITELIEFCFRYGVPTKDALLHQTDDIGKYLYHCLEYRKCAICNAKADVHHVDPVGMGANRQKVCHIGMLAIALCRKHHQEAHIREKELFESYHVYGIKLDKYLCDRLSLNTEKKRNV